MILPKGFVTNSEDIYKEVASYPVVPPEKIREYWGGEWSPSAHPRLPRRPGASSILVVLTLRSVYDDVPPPH